MSAFLDNDISADVKHLSNMVQDKQKQNILDGMGEAAKTVDDIKYLKTQKELYIDLHDDLLDFDGDEQKEEVSVDDEGKIVGELVIFGKTIFKNIGLDYFVQIDRVECMEFLEERLESITETEFVLDNKLNNIVRNLKVSYPVLDPYVQTQVNSCINENGLADMFNNDVLIERNLQTGDLMPSGIITDDGRNEYIFNDSYGTADDTVMDIVEQLDESGNIISSKLESSSKDSKDEPKRGKNYKKNKKKRARAKAKKREKAQLQVEKLSEVERAENEDEFLEMLQDMGIINKAQIDTKKQEAAEVKEGLGNNLPIIKEVDLKDIKILGPQMNEANGQVELPEYLKYTDPNKPAIAPNDILEYTDLINALESLDVKEVESDDGAVISDIVETELLPADVEYDYEKLNKYLIENDDEEMDLANMKFEEADLFHEDDFDITKLIVNTKKEALKEKINELLIENKYYKFDPNKVPSTKSILKNLEMDKSGSQDENKKTVAFASSLEIKEFENTKLFNKRNTFVNMAYYMNLDVPVEIEMDSITRKNTNYNKESITTIVFEEEEAQTDTLDMSEIDHILEETVNKLTGGDDLKNGNAESTFNHSASEKKEHVSRFKKDRESRKSKRNSLIFSELTNLDFTGSPLSEESATGVESTIIEHDLVVEEGFIDDNVETEEGDDSFNTIYLKSLQNENNFFSSTESEEEVKYEKNIFLEEESNFEENNEDDDDDEYDLGPIEEEEFNKNFEAKRKLKKDVKAEERLLDEMVESQYEFPEELIKAINEDKDIEVIQQPKIDFSQFRTTEEMAEAYNMDLYDDDYDEFSSKNYKQVEGMPIDYTDDGNKGYIIEKLKDFEGYNEQVELLKDDISTFIKNTTQAQFFSEEEDDDAPLMVDIIENELELDSSLNPPINSDVFEDDDVNYFSFNDENEYRLSESVLKEDISREYQRLKQNIIKKQELEATTSDITEHESRQFEPIDESGNPVKKSRFKQRRIKMNL